MDEFTNIQTAYTKKLDNKNQKTNNINNDNTNKTNNNLFMDC